MDAKDRRFPDLRWHALRLWQSPMTWGICLLLTGVRLWSMVQAEQDLAFYTLWGLSREGIRSFALWQWISYALIHGSWLHWGMNSLLLLALGSRIETMLGRQLLLRFLLAGILVGGLLHLFASAKVLVGISGGVFALLLGLTTLSPESRFLVPFRVSGKNLGRGVMAASLILALLDPELGLPGLSAVGGKWVGLGFESWFRVSHACHFGGAFAGWLVASHLLRPRVSLERLRRERARREGMAQRTR